MQVAEAEAVDVDAAVAAAWRAFEASSWSGIKPAARTNALLKIADLIDAIIDELTAIETLDNGVPLKDRASARRIGGGHIPLLRRMAFQDIRPY
jgi:acyl-CoA reductase-like NAD-dependent aldehyde dehydrogenase